jgi:microcin C transport system substrate-binding protein
VKFSHDIFMEQGLESYRMATAGYITAVEVLDDRRVRFEFSPEAPARDRIPLAGGPHHPEPGRVRAHRRAHRRVERRALPGLGPLRADGLGHGPPDPAAADEDYWGSDLPINVGRNNFDTIRVEYFADATVALEAFKAASTRSGRDRPLLWATAYDFPAVQSGQVVREEIPTARSRSRPTGPTTCAARSSKTSACARR